MVCGSLLAQQTDSSTTFVEKPIEGLKYKQQPGLALAASKIFFSERPWSVSGFGEVNYVSYFGQPLTQSNDLELYYTSLYRLATFFGYRFTDKIIWNSEFQIEMLEYQFNEFMFEPLIEAFFDFLIHDKFKARIGYYPLTIGYTNNNDEPVMFYSVNRYEVERLITPSTWIEFGAMFYGNLTDDLSYALGLSQGLQAKNFVAGTWIRQGRDIRFDIPNSISINPQLTYTGLEGITISASGYYGPSGQAMSVDQNGQTREVGATINLTTGYFKYENEHFRFVSVGNYGRLGDTELIYSLSEQQGDFGAQVLGQETYGYLFEAGYDILPLFNMRVKKERKGNFFYRANEIKLPVFVRYERLDTHWGINSGLQNRLALMQNPSFLRNDMHILVVGANFNTRENIVFKANYQFRNNLANSQDGDIFELGFGFIF